VAFRHLLSTWALVGSLVIIYQQATTAENYDNLERAADLLSSQNNNGVPIATLSKDALKAKLDRRERLFLVEVADRKHFSRCHLPGSIALQLKQSRRKARTKLRDRQAQIVLYSLGPATQECERLARDLVAQGYTDVRIYPGGATEWVNSGYPTEGSHPRDP
jgi:rhodanese-related sulfurtransferase